MKCKPITAKAAEATKPSPNKYMGGLVNSLKGMYQSKGYVDPARGFGAGLQRAHATNQAYNKK